jgi:hypothetical protein
VAAVFGLHVLETTLCCREQAHSAPVAKSNMRKVGGFSLLRKDIYSGNALDQGERTRKLRIESGQNRRAHIQESLTINEANATRMRLEERASARFPGRFVA